MFPQYDFCVPPSGTCQEQWSPQWVLSGSEIEDSSPGRTLSPRLNTSRGDSGKGEGEARMCLGHLLCAKPYAGHTLMTGFLTESLGQFWKQVKFAVITEKKLPRRGHLPMPAQPRGAAGWSFKVWSFSDCGSWPSEALTKPSPPTSAHPRQHLRSISRAPLATSVLGQSDELLRTRCKRLDEEHHRLLFPRGHQD